MEKSMGLLYNGALELGLTLDDEKLSKFETYYEALRTWNQKVNLTAITEYSSVQIKHFLDSLTCFPLVNDKLPQKPMFIDIGAGAGFPLLPLKLAVPEINITLVDSVGKKTKFIQHLVDLLELPNVTIITDRAEKLGHDPIHREMFDLVLVRGVAKFPTLLEYALPLCRLGGEVIAWKHGGIEAELARGAHALKTLGGATPRIELITLPDLNDDRILVSIEKIFHTPTLYPRQPGTPYKNPL